MLGAGAQARLQLAAAHLVRPFARALVWARDAAKAEDCSRDIAAMLEIEARAVADPARLVAESQLVVTATPARRPILGAEWLHPGLHITAIGADSPEKNEIAPAAIARADRFVCDRRSQSSQSGELHHAEKSGLLRDGFAAIELGEVIAGTAPGRTSPEAITICDLTGTGVQDTAIATFALRRAAEHGLGAALAA